MQCSNSGPDIRLLVDLLTENGPDQVCALFDSGATISLIQPGLHPKILKTNGYMNLHGFQLDSPAQQAQLVTVSISLDGITWQTMEAAITPNMAERMIISPQGISGYSFQLQGYEVQAYHA